MSCRNAIVLALSFAWSISGMAFGQSPGWQPNAQFQDELQKKNTSWIYREEGVPAYALPDALLTTGGQRVETKEQWQQTRRPETLDLFAKHVYGRTIKPLKVSFEVLSTDEKALDGAATRQRVKITAADEQGKSYSFEAALLTPNKAKGPVPAFVLINNRGVDAADPNLEAKSEFWPVDEIIGRGYATAVFRTNDVDPDKKEEAARADGVRGVWPAGGGTVGEDAWATIGAWAWGASRVLDFLETQPKIDAKRVAVIGHSRGGKTALWAGAQDERFALTISNNSGCGGAALSRRQFGETVAIINRAFPHWFNENFKKYDGHEADLPVDQHQLISLIAPRAVYVASADVDLWADPRGEYLALAHASPVYALFGLEGVKLDGMPPLDSPVAVGRMGYHVRTGGHGLTLYDWQTYLNFADSLWAQK
jgi:hypothetical protein